MQSTAQACVLLYEAINSFLHLKASWVFLRQSHDAWGPGLSAWSAKMNTTPPQKTQGYVIRKFGGCCICLLTRETLEYATGPIFLPLKGLEIHCPFSESRDPRA